ncbi:MAG: hypothetical protein HZB16_11695 [Armatimonadetes bacterium]|nr:hypothetical protein [Armatimonadota bacterium]
MISTAEAAARIGVSKNTLLRWIAEGRLTDVARDWRNWRVWGEADVARAKALRDQLHLVADASADSAAADGSGTSTEPAQPAVGRRLHQVPYKPVGPGEYAVDLGRLGEGRGFRHDDDERSASRPKVVMPLYAAELDSLGDARQFRAGEVAGEGKRHAS